jgi:hypothetical protein
VSITAGIPLSVELRDFIRDERRLLRDEEMNLKGCQVQYIMTAILATGAILGISTGMLKDLFPHYAFVSLMPLLIVLPFWWLFFDKATTVTRIVGYLRVIEGILIGDLVARDYVGWQRGLAHFRAHPPTGSDPGRLHPGVVATLCATGVGLFWQGLMLFGTGRTHRYWIICNYAFLLLAAGSWSASFVWWLGHDEDFLDKAISHGGGLIVLGVFGVLVYGSMVWNSVMVHRLVRGRYSYDHNESDWLRILSVESPSSNVQVEGDDDGHDVNPAELPVVSLGNVDTPRRPPDV